VSSPDSLDVSHSGVPLGDASRALPRGPSRGGRGPGRRSVCATYQPAGNRVDSAPAEGGRQECHRARPTGRAGSSTGAGGPRRTTCGPGWRPRPGSGSTCCGTGATGRHRTRACRPNRRLGRPPLRAPSRRRGDAGFPARPAAGGALLPPRRPPLAPAERAQRGGQRAGRGLERGRGRRLDGCPERAPQSVAGPGHGATPRRLARGRAAPRRGRAREGPAHRRASRPRRRGRAVGSAPGGAAWASDLYPSAPAGPPGRTRHGGSRTSSWAG